MEEEKVIAIESVDETDANENLVYCRECGREIDLDELVELREYIQLDDDEFLCDVCASSCCECGDLIPPGEEHESQNGNIYCDHCADRFLIQCASCGEAVEYDSIVDVFHFRGRSHVCESCVENNRSCYFQCADCGRYWDTSCMEEGWDEDGEGFIDLCPDCIGNWPSEPPQQIIFEYDWRPDVWDYYVTEEEDIEKTVLYGVELEIDHGGQSHPNARLLIDTINKGGGSWYAKRDGSLSCGFELVSMPSSLNFHLKGAEAFACFVKQAIEMGYRSHDAGTCGLHVHVSREALGETDDEKEATIGKILLWMDWHWDNFVNFSRRSQQQLDQWAARYGCIEPEDKPQDAYRKACTTCDRYVCLNLTNVETVEFRMFRGTLVPETYYATLEFVDATVRFCRSMSIDEMHTVPWGLFVQFCGGYKYLPAYLAKKGLV